MAKYNKEDLIRLDGILRNICVFDEMQGIKFSVGDVERCAFIEIEFMADVEDKFKNTVYATVTNFLTLSGFEFEGELNDFGIVIQFVDISEVFFVNTVYDNYIEE